MDSRSSLFAWVPYSPTRSEFITILGLTWTEDGASCPVSIAALIMSASTPFFHASRQLSHAFFFVMAVSHMVKTPVVGVVDELEPALLLSRACS